MNANPPDKTVCWGEKGDNVRQSVAPATDDLDRAMNGVQLPASSSVKAFSALTAWASTPTNTRVHSLEEVAAMKVEKKALKKKEHISVSSRGYRARTLGHRVMLALMISLCLVWTVWLLLLNISPSSTVNRIMDTASFEEGSFWLFVDPPLPVYRLAIVGLSSVALGFTMVLFKLMTTLRGRARVSPARGPMKRIHVLIKAIVELVHSTATSRTASRSFSSAASIAFSLASSEGLARKRINLCIKFADLAVETIMLMQILEDGVPVELAIVFTLIVATNAIGCALMMFIQFEQAALVENAVDLLFDMMIAVGYPMLTVCYCLSTFNFDREKMAINLEVFPKGWYEQSASAIADPMQTVIVYKILGSLRITSVLNFFTRMGINISLWFKLRRTLELGENSRKEQASAYPKRSRAAATSLVVFSGLLVIYVEESTRASSNACRPYPECVINAWRWTTSQCPCLAFIDNDLAPKTFAEWVNPKDVTDKVAALAAVGDLQIIQLTNRKLPLLPEEVRNCAGMRYMSLVYTYTETLPNWIKELTKLEYLHIEGNSFGGLLSLPDDTFNDMTSLTILHVGMNMALKKLPSFDSLTNLKILAVASSFSLLELPAFDSLHKLERLVIAVNPLLDSLPDFTPIDNLKSFVAMDRGAWCCNGFLGECDLENPLCGVHPLWGTPAATCLPTNRTEKVASAATLNVAAKFAASICGDVLRPTNSQPPPTQVTMASCGGILYRKCEFPGAPESMCYNARLMGITCTPSPFPVEMRRRQIKQKVGDPCNPEYEAWLGCQ